MSFISDPDTIPAPRGGELANFTPPDERQQSRDFDKVLTALRELRTHVLATAGTITEVTGSAPIAVANGTTAPAVSVAAATTNAPGSMSAADKTKLDALLAASYGETSEFNETGSAIVLTSKSLGYRWITGGSGLVKGTGFVTWDDTAAPGGKRLTIGASGAGTYLVVASFAGVLAAHADLSMDIYKNAGAMANITCDFHVTEDASYVAGSAVGVLTLAAGDTLSMYFQSSTDTNTFTIKHGNISIVRVAP